MLDFLNGTMTMEGFIVLVAFVLVAVKDLIKERILKKK